MESSNRRKLEVSIGTMASNSRIAEQYNGVRRMMELSNHRILKVSNGTMAFNGGMVESSKTRIVECGIVELSNSGSVESSNCRIVEVSNGTMASNRRIVE